MANKRLLREYKRSLKKIQTHTKSLGISDSEFENIFENCLKNVTSKDSLSFRTILKKYLILRLLCTISFIILLFYSINFMFDGKPFSLFFCKIQEFIYPGLRFLRIISIPIISAFPSLTELYDETCLIQNPYFHITDMDCWPCNSISYVTELTTIDFDPNASPPFLYKTEQKKVTFEDLKAVYKNNEKVFDKDASKIIVNHKNTMFVGDFFLNYYFNSSRKKNGSNFMWRLNRMFPAQLIRALFPRPKAIPRLGLSTERFVLIDEPGTRSYVLTDPECNFVFITQSDGERLIILQPAPECQGQCSPVSVLLKPPYLLWYNWWYWRPISHPTSTNLTSIAYIGSYC